MKDYKLKMNDVLLFFIGTQQEITLRVVSMRVNIKISYWLSIFHMLWGDFIYFKYSYHNMQ